MGYQQPLNKLSDQLRRVIAEAGYTELLTFALASKKDNYTNLRLPEGSDAVIVANPMSSEYEVRLTATTRLWLRDTQCFGGNAWLTPAPFAAALGRLCARH